MLKKTLLAFVFSFVLIGFSSCSDDDKTPTDNNNNGTETTIPGRVISGKIKLRKLDYLTDTYSMTDWNKGPATLKLSYATDEHIATAEVGSDGSFTLNLPNKLPSEKFFSPSLIYQIAPSPTNLKMTTVPLVFSITYQLNNAEMMGFIHIATFTDNSLYEVKNTYSIYCFDNAGSVAGTHNYSGDTYSLQASKGWNFMYSEKLQNNKLNFKLSYELPTDTYFYTF